MAWAIGLSSATAARHCSQRRRCAAKLIASSWSRTWSTHPAASGCGPALSWASCGGMETPLGKRGAQRLQAVEHARLDRAERHTQALGDLRLCQALLLG